MKSILVVCFFQIYFCDLFSQGGNLLDTSKVWTDFYQVYTSTYTADDEMFKLDGIVKINDTAYYKIYYSMMNTSEYSNHYFSNWGFYNYYIRESSHRVFIRKAVSNTEQLLYDFNLKVNDSIYLNSTLFRVDSVDTIEINNLKRKRLKLVGIYGDTWIEGIGSLFGLIYSGFSPYYPNWCGCGVPKLQCVYDNSMNIYSRGNGECASILEIKNKDISNIKIFPTIIENSLNINESSNDKYMFNLYNLNGELLNKTPCIGNVKIDLSYLKEGFYIIQITGDKINYRNNIIKK